MADAGSGVSNVGALNQYVVAYNDYNGNVFISTEIGLQRDIIYVPNENATYSSNPNDWNLEDPSYVDPSEISNNDNNDINDDNNNDWNNDNNNNNDDGNQQQELSVKSSSNVLNDSLILNSRGRVYVLATIENHIYGG